MAAPSEDRVKQIIAEVYAGGGDGGSLRWQDIDSDRPLFSLEDGEESLGLDSLDAVEVATAVEAEFDLVLPAELDPMELRTVRQLMSLIGRVWAEQHGST